MCLLAVAVSCAESALDSGMGMFETEFHELSDQDRIVDREMTNLRAVGTALEKTVETLEIVVNHNNNFRGGGGSDGESVGGAERRSLRQQSQQGSVEPANEFGGKEGAVQKLDDAASFPEQFGTYGTLLGKLHKEAMRNTKQLRALQKAGGTLKAQVSKLEALVAAGSASADALWTSCASGDAKATLSGVIAAPALLAKLDEASQCKHVKSIEVQTDGTGVLIDLVALGTTLDTFLAQHFDWQVRAEPYKGVPGPFIFAPNTRPGHAAVLRHAQANQMPKKCDSKKLLIANDPWRFFGSLWGVFTHELEAAVADGSTIFSPVIYNAVGVGANMRYEWLGVGDSWCPQSLQKNKWLCYFLPLTKCQAPTVYADKTCRAGKAKGGLKECTEGYFTYSKGTADTRKQVRRDWSGSGMYGVPPIPKEAGVTDMAGGGPNAESLWIRTVYQMLLSRMNYRTRAKLHAQIEAFLTGPAQDWDAKEQCVTVHARRGDKLAALGNLGAQDPRRWQREGFSKTFKDYVNAAKDMLAKLPGEGKKNTIFILTDDPGWVDQHKKDHPEMKIFGIGGKGQPEGPGQDKMTDDAFDLFTSFMLAPRCGGFVGNFDSNVSARAFQFMCYYRDRCPAYFSFGKNKHWQQLGR